ncbi:MAG: CarD family transcriptional regulator [Desulfovibrio sp.]|jgi:CarD family transcriptional regulator|nr:CarD family transcriptional regulator [Desulfovibrio sp.]
MFSIHDTVVYPGQGIGSIQGIEDRELGDAGCQVYVIGIRMTDLTLIVPVQNADRVGLRSLASAEECRGVLEFLRTSRQEVPPPGFQNWHRRSREYDKRLASPDLRGCAEVLAELLTIGRLKQLSFAERRTRDHALSIVLGEIAEVLGVEEGPMREELEAIHAPAVAETVRS